VGRSACGGWSGVRDTTVKESRKPSKTGTIWKYRVLGPRWRLSRLKESLGEMSQQPIEQARELPDGSALLLGGVWRGSGQGTIRQRPMIGGLFSSLSQGQNCLGQGWAEDVSFHLCDRDAAGWIRRANRAALDGAQVTRNNDALPGTCHRGPRQTGSDRHSVNLARHGPAEKEHGRIRVRDSSGARVSGCVNIVPQWNYIDRTCSCRRDPDRAKMGLCPAHVSTNSSRLPRRMTAS